MNKRPSRKAPLVPGEYAGDPPRRPFVVPPGGSHPAPEEDPYLKLLLDRMDDAKQRGQAETKPPASSFLSRLPIWRVAPPDPLERSSTPLHDLYQICTSDQHNPYEAWRAVLLSADARVPVPPWAAEVLRNLWQRRHKDKNINLDVEFGFKAKGRGKDKTSQVYRTLLARRTELSMGCIWLLTLLGYTLEQACEMEARRIRADNRTWNRTDYDVHYPVSERDIAGSLQTEFRKWKKTDAARIATVTEQWTRPDIEAHRVEFLACFPPAE